MSGLFLLEMTLKASLVLVVAWAVTRALSARSSASTRHLVWLAAVAGLVLLPALMLFGPAWRVAVVPGAWAATHAPVDPSRPAAKPRPRRMASARSFTWTGALTWPVLIVGLWAAGAVLAALRLIAGLSWAHWIARRSTPVVAADWAGKVTPFGGTPETLMRARQILRGTPEPRWSAIIAAIAQAKPPAALKDRF